MILSMKACKQPISSLQILLFLLFSPLLPAAFAGNAIFVHPDGAGVSAWTALRMVKAGPDGRIAWDDFDRAAPYTGHMKDSLVATSNGGATSHAYGVKVVSDSFGMDGTQRIASLSKFDGSIVHEAMLRDKRTGLVNSGHLCEPGTAAFAARSPSRKDTDLIAAEIISSGVDVLLAGGERYLLPVGTAGRHGIGVRKDGRNLVEEAKAAGYTVVYNRDELLAIDPNSTSRLLGVFAHDHTFNDKPEEILAATGLPLYSPDAPTLAEMTRVAAEILKRGDQGFLLIVEEEGSDNFGNVNNAKGLLEALHRADDAIAVAMNIAKETPGTLVLTAADSNAGGPQVVCHPLGSKTAFKPGDKLPGRMNNAAPLDGVDGFIGKPFLSAPDKSGQQFAFGIAWSSYIDVAGDIVAKSFGAHADQLPAVTDNTDIYRMLYLALFDKKLD